MAKAALAMLLIGGMTAWGQSQNQTSGGAEKVDRAAAYYHYTLAQMYTYLAASLPVGRSSDYADKAVQELRMATKADPQSAMLREELSRGPGSHRFVAPFFRPLPQRQRQDAGTNPK